MITIRVQETVRGTLPRIPKSKWGSKVRKPQTVTMSYENLNTGEKEEGSEFEMPGGLYLEDILIWCKCLDLNLPDYPDATYIREKDGTEGTVCNLCGGVQQLG